MTDATKTDETLTTYSDDDGLAWLEEIARMQDEPEEDEPAPVVEVSPYEPCGRCGGRGELSGYEHIMGGVCFKCWGSKVQVRR